MNDYYAVLGIEKNTAPDEIKAAYRFLVMQLHPDKHQGQGQGARIAEKKFKEITEAYEILSDDEKRAAYDKQNHGMDFQNQTWTYQRADTNTGAEREAREQSEKEAREQREREKRERREREKRERREQQEKEQSYYRQEPYNDYVVDREIPYESKSRQTESSNTFIKLLVGIIAFVIFVHIVQSCPTKKEPNRTPSPRVEYVLPKSEGSSITVNSDILTKYFGISYEQRQRSNLFMKDSHEYRYNGNGTWTITKKSAVNNTNKNYIDTNSKTDVENYLHGLGF